MDCDAYFLFTAISECHRLLKDLANQLGLRADVSKVTHWTDLSNLDEACRLEEYVDVELVNGQAMSWCLELTVTPNEIVVEADVRRNDQEGQDVLAEVANCEFRTVKAATDGLVEITRGLCSVAPL